MDSLAYRNGIQLHFIRSGKPVENGFVESCNGRLRMSASTPAFFLAERCARKLEDWRADYNQIRPHSAADDALKAAAEPRWTYRTTQDRT